MALGQQKRGVREGRLVLGEGIATEFGPSFLELCGEAESDVAADTLVGLDAFTNFVG